ncbi:hypothetical protein D910_10164 [Dendroctonus ponderosae]
MMSKTLLVFALIVVGAYALEHKIIEHYAYPKYEFKYGVHDPKTEDKKERSEKRDGHKVEQEYKWDQKDRKVELKKWDSEGKFVKFEIKH